MSVSAAELRAFERTYGKLGESERRTFTLEKARVTESGSGDGRLKVVGLASVFDSPSLEMRSPLGSFVERIAPGAFTDVLARGVDCILTWDHLTHLALARTGAGLELTETARGLRYFASCSRTSYAEDLRQLMADGVISQSSFTFEVASGGEEWKVGSDGGVQRTIHRVSALHDVCICAAGAYPAASSALARSLMIDYATKRGLLTEDPNLALRRARALAALKLQRQRLVA